MNKTLKLKNGFTIVELLIVIVVIAILAAISIVAYNGIQARAKLTQQVADLDRIGRAIQLWSAENDKTLGSSGSGYNGQGLGSFTATTTNNSAYTSTSISQLLRSSGYLQGDITSFDEANVMAAPCTSLGDTRWLVMAIVNPAPQKPISEQIADTGCTSGYATTYTSLHYGRNLIKAY